MSITAQATRHEEYLFDKTQASALQHRLFQSTTISATPLMCIPQARRFAAPMNAMVHRRAHRPWTS